VKENDREIQARLEVARWNQFMSQSGNKAAQHLSGRSKELSG
jgi:hypothetical protein